MVHNCGCGVATGIPNGVNVSCEHVPSFEFFQYVCQIHNDNSNAPATALILESRDLGINKTVKFRESDLPLSDTSITMVNVSQLAVVPKNYSLVLYAVNQLGSALVLNNTVCLGKCYHMHVI